MLIPNPGKNLSIEVEGKKYDRFPIKTPVIKKGDDLVVIIKNGTGQYLESGDFIFISEKIVAISQGRAYPISEIKPSWMAKFLVRFVYKSPYGIGLGSPWTMELAVREVGYFRILFAALLAAFTKPLGIRGVFYLVAGREVAAIDGPCSYTLPPYNKYAKLGPAKPHKVAQFLKEKLGHEVIIIDANDLGVNVLGKSNREIKDAWTKAIFKDNPLGQTNEQTPVCIVRELK
ncbi:MAG: Gamma-glutamyl ligase superfamily [Candidatus Magasanikbacteria bacterium GW2011_GWC2_40_17]|uniref:Gamma-glutamyl ligase superfamily n=1 Tax=Candidatus Magasanikbacteria bacterium GW2011_GWA2_42_32 TaxID=1619039 RepID=A0A0G1D5K4_9BACT|nr:MAG: Gamma-glutamyl ligase superfamily [Candidatus Magasanikbacteria bacterium GW2011_GWC2_40_17]KKS57323.1 MAG: Gamma-glutamyl ligase superfamily [Candidatus Magasanikbacteria bacterium GW2011_GWA2_42_32]OGH85805.1 MAG: F420-0--gamma-glutamyl ligase [Candidatus Magasanikbacteria bacterium RIFOXYB2_FULL_38_10]